LYTGSKISELTRLVVFLPSGVAKPRRTSTSPSAARKNEVNEAASSNAARLAQLLSPASAKSEDQDEKSERYFGRGTTKEGKRAGVGSMIVTMVS